MFKRVMIALAWLGAAAFLGPPAAQAARAVSAAATTSPLCLEQQTGSLDGGKYYLQPNEYNSTAAFEICSNGAVESDITKSSIDVATDGAPGGYPSLYRGNHWGTMTEDSGLPVEVSALDKGGVVTTSVSTTTTRSGTWDDAYDIFFAPTPTGNQNGADVEMMVWLTHDGSVQPAGSIVASDVTVGGHKYNVWRNRTTVTFDSATAETSVSNLDLGPLAAYAVSEGYIPSTSWYLMDVEHGFEIWDGGAGLEDNSFSVCTPAGCLVF
jgi:hypothetical protein